MEVTRTSTSRQLPCTECYRRKQKCKPGKGHSCDNCSRRYPPVECIRRSTLVTDLLGDKIQAPDIRQVSGSDSESQAQLKRGSSNSLRISDRHVRSNARTSPSHKSGGSRPTNTEPISNLDCIYRAGKTPNGKPEGFCGILAAINNSNIAPVHSSSRNAELFYFYHQSVVPILASLDGENVPTKFLNECVPWMIQSPLMPDLALLTSVGVKARLQGLQLAKCSDVLAMRSNILSLLNQFLKQDFNHIYAEAIHFVIHLVLLEWYWGEYASMWAHMKGVKEMLRLKGGFESIKHPLLRQLLIFADCQLACNFERDLFLHRPATYEKKALPIPVPYPESFNSPLLDFSTPFVDLCETLDLSLPVAEILDDVRLLTTSITSLLSRGCFSRNDSSKLENTALCIHNRIMNVKSSSSDAGFIYETCRIAALAYSSAIMSHTPFSQGYFGDEERRQDFYSKVWKVSLTRWKKIPGIFLWILLVAGPGSGNNPYDIYLKEKTTITAMSIAVEDFDLAVGCFRAFWMAQRWIARQRADGGMA